jgi:hypothetical protein
MRSTPVFAAMLAAAVLAVQPARADRLALWTIVCGAHMSVSPDVQLRRMDDASYILMQPPMLAAP